MKKIIALLFIISVAFMTGCREYSPYQTVFVSGTVLVDGSPMPEISVVFNPVDSGIGHAAGGLTDAKGKYTLTTAGLKIGSGAVPAQYHVLFVKQAQEGYELTMEEYDKKFGIGKPGAQMIYYIPQRYGSPTTSGIEPVTVEKGKKNEFNFELSTKEK
jgi:hypothetical protein